MDFFLLKLRSFACLVLGKKTTKIFPTPSGGVYHADESHGIEAVTKSPKKHIQALAPKTGCFPMIYPQNPKLSLIGAYLMVRIPPWKSTIPLYLYFLVNILLEKLRWTNHLSCPTFTIHFKSCHKKTYLERR